MSEIITKFNEGNKTLRISGEGDLSWKDTVPYAEDTKHIIIEGDGIFSTNMSNLFARFHNLIGISGHLDTSMTKDMSYLYAECFNLTQPIQNLDTTSVEEFDFFHSDNRSLKEVKFNSTMNGIKFKDMFYGCESLTQIEGISIPSNMALSDVSNIKSVQDLILTSSMDF